MGCQKEREQKEKGCKIYAKTYFGSINNSVSKVFSWENIKRSHDRILSKIAPNLSTKQKQIITENVLSRLRTFSDKKCGKMPVSGIVEKEVSYGDGLLKQVLKLPHPYYECSLALWKEKSEEIFLKSCQQKL